MPIVPAGAAAAGGGALAGGTAAAAGTAAAGGAAAGGAAAAGTAAAAAAPVAGAVPAGAGIGSGLAAKALVNLAISAAVTGLQMAIAPKPKTGVGGVRTTSRNPIAYRNKIYGDVRTGGTFIFIDDRANQPGAKNRYLDLAIVIAAHEIESVEAMYFGDEEVWTVGGGFISKYADVAQVEFHLGVMDDPASTLLQAESDRWTPDHKLNGIAYAVLILEYNSNRYQSGIPNVEFRVKGAKVYDPRDSTTAWSDNAALCIRDYLRDDYLGFGATNDEIEEASFIAAANLCDESVALAAGGSESRYTCNGGFDSGTQIASVIEALLSSMQAQLAWSEGKWQILTPVYTAPTLSLDETHLRGSVQVQTRRSRRDNFNGVRGVFRDATEDWVEADYPPVISPTFRQVDGEPLYRDLPLPFTTSVTMAQRIAKIELLRGRAQISAVLPVNLAGMQLKAGDTVSVTIDRMGWSSKVFQVQSWQFAIHESGTLGVDLTVVETSSSIFDWSSAEEGDSAGGSPTDLPDGFTITPPGMAVSEEERVQAEDVFSVVLIDVSSSDGFAEAFEVQFKLTSESIWRNAGRATTTRFEIVKAQEGSTYDIRARVRSVTGVLSDYTTTTYYVNGSSTPPPDVSGLTAIVSGTQTVLSWTPVADLRLSHYIVRHSAKVLGATWETSTTIVPKVARPSSSVAVASRSGTYLVKAVDKLGRLSVTAATIVSPVSITEGLNVVETINESPDWAGTHSQTWNNAGALELAGTLLWDDKTGNFDDATGLVDDASLPLNTDGTYSFATTFDLGSIHTSRVYANMEWVSSGGENLFDGQDGNFDAAEGYFDDYGGSAIPGLAAWVEVRTTQDDPGGSPTWSAWEQLGANDFTARAFQFRVQLTSTIVGNSPSVTDLTVEIDMPDRIVHEADKVSGTDAGGLAIVFPGGPFRAVPAIGVTAQNIVQGDFWEIVTKSVSGFTIRFKNSSSTVVSRTFDYTARGYGRIVS